MRRLAGVTVLAGLTVAITTAQEPRVFRSATDLVHFTVTVTDRRGELAQALTADDFEVLEAGQVQTISHFARGTGDEAPDLHLGLMLDTSESMLADLDTSQTAAIKFLNRLPEAVDLTLVDFDTDVRVSQFGPGDFPRLVERIRTRESSGWTALYDAFAAYLQGTDRTGGHTVLVAFTDGGDSRSTINFDDVLTAVRASDATVYVVGFLAHARSDTRNLQRLRLSQVADASGGQAIFPSSMRQIDEAYDRIVAEIRGQYHLGYVSTDSRRDGRWRDVTIRLKGSDRRDLRVRARSGYYAPLADGP